MNHPRRRFRVLLIVAIAGLLGAVVAAEVASLPAPNPLLRVLAPDGIFLTRQQLANPNTADGLAQIARQLEAARQPAPEYLRLVLDEYSGRPRQTARFAVGCYWEGERELGKMNGVIASRTGMIGHDEVVEVHFDPKVITAESLTGQAKKLSCFRGISSTQPSLMEDPEQQHTLANHPEFANVPMTPMQRTKVNAALSEHQDLTPFLSPAQLRLAQTKQ